VASRLFKFFGWAIVIYIVAFWRLGYPSFWDPDEAVYAVATREMLRTGDWLAPMYNGLPFFDKPILFYWLQLISFKLFGPTEFAARLVPAVSAVGVIGTTWLAGRAFFGSQVGRIAALFVAVLPATFALSAYAILDMTFTMFLFAGVVMIASAVVHDRPNRQWAGYLLLALAVLTKGPLALALAGFTFLGALAVIPSLRVKLWRLNWAWGVALVVGLSSPWFIYMWLRFGHDFIDGYFLRENILLYASNLYTTTRSPFFYLRVVALGFLPWTPILLGRAVDAFRGDPIKPEERLFWVWSIAITIFFSLSRFKLDHYIYPVLPALSIIGARAWWALRTAPSVRPHLGSAIGIIGVGLILPAAGVFAYLAIDRLPFELPQAMVLAPIGLTLAGLASLARMLMRGLRPRMWPAYPAIGMLALYSAVLAFGIQSFESAKPIKDLASWVSLDAPDDAVVTAYRLDRWKTSWRFYADRQMTTAETPEELASTLRAPGTHYTVMLKSELSDVKAAAPEQKLSIVRERRGLTNTSGKGLRRKRDEWPTFVVVKSERARAGTIEAAATAVTPVTPAEPAVTAVVTPAVSISAPASAAKAPRAHLKGRPARRPLVRSSANGRR
jgi:4-amino-4-deoxy-L-arabinose transferase-like glycosyltransferase